MNLPREFIQDYFMRYAGSPKVRSNGILNGSCPTCHEGNSWGKKRRLFYIPNGDYLICHNCNRSWKPLKWIMEMSGKSYREIAAELGDYDYCSINEVAPITQEAEKPVYRPDLPYGTVTLDDEVQIKYYAKNKTVIKALQYVTARRLDKAPYHVKYGACVDDYVHKNRLVIPFLDFSGQVIFYQTRKLFDDDPSPKYMSKGDAIKSVFGIENVDNSLPYLFITEGPIDATFVKNGVSMAGLSPNDFQINQLNTYFGHEQIWVLDNDFRRNREVLAKYVNLIREGRRVFIWPDAFIRYKDINEVCVDRELNELPWQLFVKYSYTGEDAKMKLLETLKRSTKNEDQSNHV